MRKTIMLGIVVLPLLTFPPAAVAQVQFSGSYTENFNTLANSGTTGSVFPTGWGIFESGTGWDTTYGISNGSSGTANTYSFGSNGSSDRAIGTLATSGFNPVFGVQIRNVTGGTLTAVAVGYTGEQWRLGNTGRQDKLDFQYSVTATSLDDTNTWTDFNALDFFTPNTTGPRGLLDGNAAANQTNFNEVITGLNIQNGDTFWFRWTDGIVLSGAQDGLGVDNFTLATVPEPATVLLIGAAGLGLVGLARRRLGRKLLAV